MKISFYANHGYWSQLSNNGGTATILKSVAALNKLGHKAEIVAKIDKFNWFKHKKPVAKISKNADVCIAVTVSDIGPMLDHAPKNAKKYYWCRLLENHSMPKRKILKKAKKVNVIVNSEDLYTWFMRHGIEPVDVVYQGVDLKKWRDLKLHEPKTLGFLVSSKWRKHFEFAMEVIKRLGKKKYKYYGYGVDLNHKIKVFTNKYFDWFVKNAQYSDLVKMYNLVETWVCTSTKEGLHNPPLQAGLCGCAVVYPDAPLAGCRDHCIDGKTAWQYKALDVDSAVEAIGSADKSLNEAHKELILNKIGTREQCMKKLIEVLKNE